MVVAVSLGYLATGQPWLLLALAYGFLARTATGPTLSPMGLLATLVLAPRLASSRPVPGPPKRFAQSIGLAFSVAGLVAYFAYGSVFAAQAIVAVLTVFAVMESISGFCAGTFVFNLGIRLRLVPESVRRECVVGK
jgi:hypothetical protein